MNTDSIHIKNLHYLRLTPKRSNPDDSGLDLQVAHYIYLPPPKLTLGRYIFGNFWSWLRGEGMPYGIIELTPVSVKHGIAVQPPVGCESQIRPRSSSLIKRGIHVATGTIDAGYRGELASVAVNMSGKGILLEPGERISQLVVAPVAYCGVEEVIDLDESLRGEAGWGSSGK